jgi:hypothetical protein
VGYSKRNPKNFEDAIMNSNYKFWVKELREGGHKQGFGDLQTGDCFCALGLACIAYEKATGQRTVRRDNGELYGQSLAFHMGVKEWLGLHYSNARLSGGNSVVFFNDHQRLSFNDIADIIEQNAEIIL